MFKNNLFSQITLLLIFSLTNIFAQFSTEAYKQFLSANENLSVTQLQEMYSAGLFNKSIDINSNNALYFDSVSIKYNLTENEKSLINKNGFVVTERLQQGSFGKNFEDIYHKDLPVYISSDAILHAFHSSYDKILKDTELSILIPKLTTFINSLKSEFSKIESKYSDFPKMNIMLKDLDVYLSISQKLLNEITSPYFTDNQNLINEIISDIESESFAVRKLFSESVRKIDYSQFKPRGHYVDEYHPKLTNYFKTMMWFGKIELYLIAPIDDSIIPLKDVQRQIILASLLSELIELSNTREIFNEIEFIIQSFVGEQDNVTLPNFEEVLTTLNIKSSHLFLDTLVVKDFQAELSQQSFAEQKILSQILINDPKDPDGIVPASAFMPFGQRFVIDSYITGNVVYDKVKPKDDYKRMLPSTLDILFALGNDASAQLLKPELDKHDYSKNLASLRYLIDSYDNEFWSNSIYNLWLKSIKSLNPPSDRTNLPTFMQTAAWWQQKMNSQLASWTELRHDNLLYAKQSYTGGVSCSFPYSYVEPVPLFFNSISELSTKTLEKLNSISALDQHVLDELTNYFNNLTNVADTLGIIAQKELDLISLDQDEINFLKRMLYKNPEGMCGAPLHDGWYQDLYYQDMGEENPNKEDFLVADYHTAPTDEGGYMIGWVKHAGTGPIDLAIVIAKTAENNEVAFVGPVASYYEYTSTNFTRLTDQDWQDKYLEIASRPNWTNNYIADKNGSTKELGQQLLTDIENNETPSNIPKSFLTAQNYPNPFNPSTVINFKIPQNLTNLNTRLSIYNINGELIKELLNDVLPYGSYIVQWNGDNGLGSKVASGVYFYEVRVGNKNYVGKMNLMK